LDRSKWTECLTAVLVTVGRPAESIDGWFNDLTAYETTLEAMATASLDQNFTDELSAIEQCELNGILLFAPTA
jgi:hypothetical protein